MDKLKMQSIDMIEKNIDKIGALFPNVITETKGEDGKLKKGINFEKLKQELSDDVNDVEESYDFTWVGKKASIVDANMPIRKTLRPCIEESKDWETTENLYIEGDNLDVLKLLQESYLNSIKMIYIDPPYNRGTDLLTYSDKFIMEKDEYDDEISYKDENNNLLFKQNNKANPRFHSDWCSMITSRLKLALNLLTNDGIIFVSIDDNEIKNLKNICDEIFGEDKLAGIIHRRKNRKPHNAGNTMSLSYEFILVYYKANTFKLAQEFSEMYHDEKGNYAIYPVLKADKKERTYLFKSGLRCDIQQLPAGIYRTGKNDNLNIEILDDGIVYNGILQNEIRIKGRFCLTDENGKLSEAMCNDNIYINANGFPKEKRYRKEEDYKIDNHHWDIEKGKNEDGDEEIKQIFGLSGENYL
ncbi:MAG: site-specific DNA-methyltransferase, partial [Actinobacteria bacterium]|nr:site-specific DNA-methyltransferase [Actinomycetota bacterium]